MEPLLRMTAYYFWNGIQTSNRLFRILAFLSLVNPGHFGVTDEASALLVKKACCGADRENTDTSCFQSDDPDGHCGFFLCSNGYPCGIPNPCWYGQAAIFQQREGDVLTKTDLFKRSFEDKRHILTDLLAHAEIYLKSLDDLADGSDKMSAQIVQQQM